MRAETSRQSVTWEHMVFCTCPCPLWPPRHPQCWFGVPSNFHKADKFANMETTNKDWLSWSIRVGASVCNCSGIWSQRSQKTGTKGLVCQATATLLPSLRKGHVEEAGWEQWSKSLTPEKGFPGVGDRPLQRLVKNATLSLPWSMPSSHTLTSSRT